MQRVQSVRKVSKITTRSFVDSTHGNDTIKIIKFPSDDDIIEAHRISMKRDNELRKKLNAPIAKYDVETGRAYLLYPNGEKVYGYDIET